jgi:hypothetical protein
VPVAERIRAGTIGLDDQRARRVRARGLIRLVAVADREGRGCLVEVRGGVGTGAVIVLGAVMELDLLTAAELE